MTHEDCTVFWLVATAISVIPFNANRPESFSPQPVFR